MKTKASGIAVLLGLAMSLASLSVQASTAWTWTLNGTPTTGTATATGYADTGTGYANNGTTETTSGKLQAMTTSASDADTPGTMNWWSGYGYGICAPNGGDQMSGSTCSTTGPHAMDNNLAHESILLSFGSAVSLTAVTIGYSSTDSDISVLAYTGSGTPSMTTNTYASLLSSGSWTVIGNYANLGVNSPQAISTSTSSSYWLVAAYNSVFSSAGCSVSGGCNDGNDYVKLLSVAGTTGGTTQRVPEPSGLLLFGTALIGALGLRRRGKAIAA
jgi:PEP-CTERM motif